MKKIYAFLAAALMSVSMFAAKDVVPSDAVLQNYYEAGQLCVCVFVPAEMACSEIVFVGTYNRDASDGWITDVNTLAKFEAVEGYDGWYVVAVDDETPADFQDKGIQGKPVILDQNGEFNWQYQIGAGTVIRGGAQIVAGQYGGEVDIINYSKASPNVYTIDALKSGNPCTAVYHNYTVTVITDGCDGLAVPFLIGSMTNWTFQQMQVNAEKSVELGAGVYYATFKCAEGMEYQVVSGLMDLTGEIIAQPAWSDESYLQKLVDDVWVRYPGVSGDNQLTGTEAEITFDVREADLRWARCAAPEDAFEVAVSLIAPAGAPAAGVDIIGSFDGWTGSVMTLANGVYTATVSATASQVFKFREAGTWDNEILIADAEAEGGWKGFPDTQFQSVWEPAAEEGKMVINLDLSDPTMYAWKVPFEEGIEEVVLTEQAQKVIVDGVLYIVRDNKMFNVQGTQVR
jgi:hypothetical protein